MTRTGAAAARRAAASIAGGLGLALAQTAPAAAAPMTLEALLAASEARGGYRAASVSETAHSEMLFRRLLEGERGPAIKEELAASNFEVVAVNAGEVRYTAVLEAVGARRGGGIYLFRNGEGEAKGGLALQTPHRYSDLDTGDIARRLIEARPVAAAAWNTVPRSYRSDGFVIDADLAHATTTHFNAFTRAFAALRPEGIIVQIHGFAAGQRHTAAGAASDVIASGAVESPGPAVRARVRCIAAAFGDWRVSLFPEDVRELGGLTNANAATTRAVSDIPFLHLELSRPARRRLAAEDDAAARLADCLVEDAP